MHNQKTQPPPRPNQLLLERNRSSYAFGVEARAVEAVVDSASEHSALLDAVTLRRTAALPLPAGANCLLYDSGSKRTYLTAGGAPRDTRDMDQLVRLYLFSSITLIVHHI